MTDNLDAVKVEQCDIDMANDYLSSAFRCTATLAERFARHRLSARTPSAGAGEDAELIGRVARQLYCAQEEIRYDQNIAHVEYWFDEKQCAENGESCMREEYERMARAALSTLREGKNSHE